MGGRRCFLTLKFTDRPEGPGKVWSCVILNLGIMEPLSSIVDCLWHPNGAIEAFGILSRMDMGSGRA